jgi:hypothetical protein
VAAAGPAAYRSTLRLLVVRCSNNPCSGKKEPYAGVNIRAAMAAPPSPPVWPDSVRGLPGRDRSRGSLGSALVASGAAYLSCARAERGIARGQLRRRRGSARVGGARAAPAAARRGTAVRIYRAARRRRVHGAWRRGYVTRARRARRLLIARLRPWLIAIRRCAAAIACMHRAYINCSSDRPKATPADLDPWWTQGISGCQCNGV